MSPAEVSKGKLELHLQDTPLVLFTPVKGSELIGKAAYSFARLFDDGSNPNLGRFEDWAEGFYQRWEQDMGLTRTARGGAVYTLNIYPLKRLLSGNVPRKNTLQPNLWENSIGGLMRKGYSIFLTSKDHIDMAATAY